MRKKLDTVSKKLYLDAYTPSYPLFFWNNFVNRPRKNHRYNPRGYTRCVAAHIVFFSCLHRCCRWNFCRNRERDSRNNTSAKGKDPSWRRLRWWERKRSNTSVCHSSYHPMIWTTANKLCTPKQSLKHQMGVEYQFHLSNFIIQTSGWSRWRVGAGSFPVLKTKSRVF